MPCKPGTCSIDGCERPLKGRGLCWSHWRQAINGWRTDCRVIDCDRVPHGKGLCRPHYDAHRSGYDVGIGPTMFGVFGRTECEKCDREPMGGGRFCLTHFHEYVTEQDKLNPLRRTKYGPVECGTQRGRDRHARRHEPMCHKCDAVVADWLTRMTRVA